MSIYLLLLLSLLISCDALKFISSSNIHRYNIPLIRKISPVRPPTIRSTSLRCNANDNDDNNNNNNNNNSGNFWSSLSEDNKDDIKTTTVAFAIALLVRLFIGLNIL